MNERKPRVLLGRGGDSPGVEALPCNGGQPYPVVSLAPGYSVYAIAADPEAHWTAVGTRRGTIHLLGPGDEERAVLDQGAPVLSLCFMGPQTLIAADSRGRCLRWDLSADPATHDALTCNDAVICRLLRIHDRLIGVCSTGGLLIWDCPLGSHMHAVETPRPATPIVLAKAVYWRETNRLTFPAENGHLVLCDMDSDEVWTEEAHEPGFLAVTTLNEDLVTVGRREGCLKRWDSRTKTVKHAKAISAGAVSACSIPGLDDRILLVKETGEAWVYGAREDEAVPPLSLSGSDYRVAVGPNAESIEAFLNEERTAEARRITERLNGALAAGKAVDVTEDLRRLECLGFAQVSLGIQAHQAALAGDCALELMLRSRLADLLPDVPEAIEALKTYGETLEHTWHFEEHSASGNESIQLTRQPARNDGLSSLRSVLA